MGLNDEGSESNGDLESEVDDHAQAIISMVQKDEHLSPEEKIAIIQKQKAFMKEQKSDRKQPTTGFRQPSHTRSRSGAQFEVRPVNGSNYSFND